MSENRRILLVEDDSSLGYLLSEYLSMKSFEVVWAKNGVEALKEMDKRLFDLAVLDVMMPEMDGFTLAKKMQERHIGIPFLFLTSRSMKVDVLKGFSLGAVDYLKKPIDEEELVVRLNSLLARISSVNSGPNQPDTGEIGLGDYVFDPELGELRHKSGSIQKLTQREAGVLELLLRNKNELCTHKEILNTLWGKNDFFTKKSLNVFVSHLRKYLSSDPSLRIENIHNQGFVLRDSR